MEGHCNPFNSTAQPSPSPSPSPGCSVTEAQDEHTGTNNGNDVGSPNPPPNLPSHDNLAEFSDTDGKHRHAGACVWPAHVGSSSGGRGRALWRSARYRATVPVGSDEAGNARNPMRSTTGQPVRLIGRSVAEPAGDAGAGLSGKDMPLFPFSSFFFLC